MRTTIELSKPKIVVSGNSQGGFGTSIYTWSDSGLTWSGDSVWGGATLTSGVGPHQFITINNKTILGTTSATYDDPTVTYDSTSTVYAGGVNISDPGPSIMAITDYHRTLSIGNLLVESGDFLLQEDSSNILI